VTNALAYCAVLQEKNVFGISFGHSTNFVPNVIKLFTTVIDECSL
jgi:hypothetical protein